MAKHVGEIFAGTRGEELKEFYYKASMHGYGSEANQTDAESADGSTVIEYESGDWRYKDVYYGGEPYSGMTTIFFRGVACFTLVYWGKVLPGVKKQDVYDCLMPALMKANPSHPWRGPNVFRAANGLQYVNVWHGNVEEFHGHEEITDENGSLLFETNYRGGIVNMT
jgi:hypothetical protein